MSQNNVSDVIIEEIESLERACFQEPWSAKQISTTLQNGLVAFWKRGDIFLWLAPQNRASLLPVQNRPAAETARSPARSLAYILAQFPGPDIEILRMGVLPEESGQGIGKKLLAAFISILLKKREGQDWKLLLEVSENNGRALQLYAGCGLQVAGKRPAYYSDGSAALLMEKEFRSKEQL